MPTQKYQITHNTCRKNIEAAGQSCKLDVSGGMGERVKRTTCNAVLTFCNIGEKNKQIEIIFELTTSFIDTGAFNASTISPALADPALDRILLNWSDIEIEADLECVPRGLSENPEESWPVVTIGLLLPVEWYRLLESEDAILRWGGGTGGRENVEVNSARAQIRVGGIQFAGVFRSDLVHFGCVFCVSPRLFTSDCTYLSVNGKGMT